MSRAQERWLDLAQRRIISIHNNPPTSNSLFRKGKFILVSLHLSRQRFSPFPVLMPSLLRLSLAQRMIWFYPSKTCDLTHGPYGLDIPPHPRVSLMNRSAKRWSSFYSSECVLFCYVFSWVILWWYQFRSLSMAFSFLFFHFVCTWWFYSVTIVHSYMYRHLSCV